MKVKRENIYISSVAFIKNGIAFFTRVSIFHVILFFLITVSYSAISQENEYLQAKALQFRGEYKPALRKYLRIIAESKENADALNNAGILYYNINNFDSALHFFKLAEQTGQGTSSFYIARCYAKKEKFDEAVYYLKKHLVSSNKLSKRLVIGDQAFDAISKTPAWKNLWKEEYYTESELLFSEAEYFIERNKPAEALEALMNIENKQPSNHYMHYLKGKVFHIQKNYELSSKEYSAAIKKSPYNSEYFFQSAKLYFESNKPEKARYDIEKAIKHGEFNFQHILLKAKIEHAIGKFEDAIVTLNNYMSYFPDDADSKYFLSVILFDKKDYLDALKVLNELLLKNKSSKDLFMLRGQVLIACKSYENAVFDFNQILDLDPFYSEAYTNRGIARQHLGLQKEACSDWKKAENLKSTEAITLLMQFCK